MIMDDAMTEIESHEFSALVNVASDLSTFLSIAEKENAVLTLMKELDSPVEQQRLFWHTIELSMSSTDIRYENQWDTALALYLWAASFKNHRLAMLMAGVVSRASRCWWAAKMSYALLTQSPLHNDAGLADSEVLRYASISYSVTDRMNTGETILPVTYLSDAAKWGPIWHLVELQSDPQRAIVTGSSSGESRKPRVCAVTGVASGTT